LIQTGRRPIRNANSLFLANRWKEAIPVFQKAIRLNPIAASFAFISLGLAYRLMGQIDESVSTYKQAILRSPDNIFARIGLASSYIAMGREKEAQAEAAEVLRINLNFSFDNFAKAIPFRDQSVVDIIINDMRKAGLT
jgi:tetratricopeptide (TPR) repeat protein